MACAVANARARSDVYIALNRMLENDTPTACACCTNTTLEDRFPSRESYSHSCLGIISFTRVSPEICGTANTYRDQITANPSIQPKHPSALPQQLSAQHSDTTKVPIRGDVDSQRRYRAIVRGAPGNISEMANCRSNVHRTHKYHGKNWGFGHAKLRVKGRGLQHGTSCPTA